MKRMIVFISISMLFTGCVPVITWPQPDKYSLRIADNPTAQRFDLLLLSFDERTLCLSVEQWPSKTGQVHMGSDAARVTTTKGVILTARDENFGYCPGGCGVIEVPPGERLMGFISYSAFESIELLISDRGKELEFSVYPYYCSNRR